MGGVFSVLQVNNYIKNMIAQDFLLSDLRVQGEVSNCKYHQSGHVYFTLKDEGAAISCVMFAGNRAKLDFRMKDGDKVIVAGYVDVYEKTGGYQLYAKQIRLSGSGQLYEKFLALKNELEEMGMFDSRYKRPLPKHAKRIGVVTAPSGAAIRDIQNIMRRRNPGIQIILYPALVQGERAKESIVKGLGLLDRAGVDIIIVGRGGGSIEDLWAFNEEVVARAIFNCETPVISAVGHETDFTIADFVADMRAPTPSAAAELAAENIRDTIERVDNFERRLRFSMDRKLEAVKERTRQLSKRIEANSPHAVLERYTERLRRYSILLNTGVQNAVKQNKHELQLLAKRIQASGSQTVLERYKDRLRHYLFCLSSCSDRTVRDKRYRLHLLANRLDGLSPLKRLGGGFAYVSLPSGKALSSAAQVKIGETLDISLKDGRISAAVNNVELKEVVSDE